MTFAGALVPFLDKLVGPGDEIQPVETCALQNFARMQHALEDPQLLRVLTIKVLCWPFPKKPTSTSRADLSVQSTHVQLCCWHLTAVWAADCPCLNIFRI